MSVSKKRSSRIRFRHKSRDVVLSVAGPCLSALRTARGPYADNMAGLSPVFNRIGRHLDGALSQPISDSHLYGSGRRLIVAVSDTTWQNALSTSICESDIQRLVASAARILNGFDKRTGDPERSDTAARVAAQLWAQWSEDARESFRSGAIAWSGFADAALGTLLVSWPGALLEIESILSCGTPVLAIALNSGGTARNRLDRSVRAIVFQMPNWARASGAVAGSA